MNTNIIQRYINAANEGQKDTMRSISLTTLDGEFLGIRSPYSDEMSYAVASQWIDRYNNCVKMVTESGEPWFFTQSEKAFFSGFGDRRSKKVFNSRFSNLSSSRFMEWAETLSWDWSESEKKPWIINPKHPGPKHFFYDYLWGALLIANNRATPTPYLDSEGIFVDMEKMGFAKFEENEGRVEIIPVIDPHIYYDFVASREDAKKRMETIDFQVRKWIDEQSDGEVTSSPHFTLIIHLNFDKRRIANLTQAIEPVLAFMSDRNLLVFIEGPTAGHRSTRLKLPDRLGELEELKTILEKNGVPYIETWGLNILEKTSFLRGANLAITPSGSGAILTNRLLRVPSVLHRTKLFESAKDLESIPGAALILGQSSQPDRSPHLQSYTIAGEVLLESVRSRIE